MYLLSVKIDYDRGCNSYLIEISRNEKMINLQIFQVWYIIISIRRFILSKGRGGEQTAEAAIEKKGERKTSGVLNVKLGEALYC